MPDEAAAVVQPPAGDSDVAGEGVYDPLLSCLAFIAREHGQPFSRSGAIAGLPLKAGKLTVDLLPRAATRMGLSARLVKRRPERVAAMVMPFIVLMKNGDAAVITARDGRKKQVTLVMPASSTEPRVVDYAWLKQHASRYVVYVTTDLRLTGDTAGEHQPESLGHWLWGPVRQFWPSWLQIVAAALVINLLGLAVPLFVMNVYDRVIPNLAVPTLWALAAGVVIALVFDFILKLVRAIVLDRTGRRVDMTIAARIFEHALALAMGARKAPAGVLANQIREFETVRDFFTSSSIIALTDLVFIGVFVLVMWIIVGPIAYVPLAAVPLVLIVTLFIQIPLARSVERTQQQSARRQSILVESLIGIETIKAANAEGVMQRKWEDAVAATARANSSTRFWSSLALYFTNTVQQAVGVVIIVWGVFLVSDGVISVGGLIAANILSGRVLGPLGNIAMTLARAQAAFSAMRGITQLMDLESERRDQITSGRKVTEASVEFKDVSFAYDGATNKALDGVFLQISPGERVGIIGRVGSGKTTLGKLAAGFHEASSGSVLVGGVDTRAYEIADLRAALGYVPQEPELFIGTLRDNVTLGRPHATEEEIATATRLSGVDRFASTHPLGLGMPIGERGRGLSGGQRQAVALARILIRDCSILFLDEPSSALDQSSESQLVGQLDAWLGKDKTLIVCTHRGSFINLVDRLVLIEGGKIVADGPRDQVLAALKAHNEKTAASAAAGAAS